MFLLPDVTPLMTTAASFLIPVSRQVARSEFQAPQHHSTLAKWGMGPAASPEARPTE